MIDYYKILGVNKTADAEEIKRAYRKLAFTHHPDKGGDTAKFQEIQEAYGVLGDPQKRAEYDNPPQQGFNQFGGAPQGFEDIFAAFHNMGGPFSNFFHSRQPQRNRNLNIQTTITLEEAFHGKDLMANVKLPSGKDQLIEVKIPPGINNGTTLRLSGMGDDSHPSLPRGDIHLTINIAQHSKFIRQDDDLIGTLEISAIDAMLGKTVQIETIDGKTLEVKIAPGTQPNKTLSVSGYGMPSMRDSRFRGRLLINLTIKIPTDLTTEQKDLLSKHFQ